MKLLRLSIFLRPCLLVLASSLLLTAAARADPSADVAGVAGCSPTFSSATPAVVTCGTVALGATAGFASGNANLLGASASSIGFGNVIANAQFTDTVTYTASGSGNGFVGFEEVLQGTITGAGINGSQASGLFTASYNDAVSCTVSLSINGSNGTDCIAFFPIVFGVTNQIAINGSLTVQAKNGGAGGVLADFSHTAEISSVGLYDANQNLISSLVLTGASGATYGSPPTAPEPSSQLLLATGLIALGVLRRRFTN